MNWREVLSVGTGTTHRAFQELFDERIAMHTKVCTSLSSTFEEVRAAQASISELQRMKNIPETLRREQATKGN